MKFKQSSYYYRSFFFIFGSFLLEQMSTLLPPEKRQLTFSILARRQPFEILYRLNCDNLCADFQEDLEFRFSWGVTSLISRFVRGNARHQMTLKNYMNQVNVFSIPIKKIFLCVQNTMNKYCVC